MISDSQLSWCCRGYGLGVRGRLLLAKRRVTASDPDSSFTDGSDAAPLSLQPQLKRYQLTRCESEYHVSYRVHLMTTSQEDVS